MIFEMLNPGLELVLNVHKLIFTGFHNLLSTCTPKTVNLFRLFLAEQITLLSDLCTTPRGSMPFTFIHFRYFYSSMLFDTC